MTAVKPEEPGSSAQTGLWTGVGAVVGMIVLAPVVIVAAPIILPAAAAAVVVGSAGIAATAVGAAFGYVFGKKT